MTEHEIATRRGLLKAGIAASSLALAAGANDRIRGALIGCGNRGSNALLPAAKVLGVQITALCDVYKPALDRALTVLGAASGEVAQYSDYRRVLERKDIDVVYVATPDHWHAPITVAACQAGKDVYVEKPLANSVEGCQAIVAAERDYKRIVQVGLQQRSMRIYFDALELLRSGVIGKVDRSQMAWGGGSSFGRQDPVVPPPEGLDWEAFQGPAPRRPYRASRQRSWRGYFEYGSGTITDFGVHLLDVARWFLNLETPQSCYAAGYRSAGRSEEQVPDAVEGLWKYDGMLITYSNRREGMLNAFLGERGTLSVNRGVLRTMLYGEQGKAPETKESRVVDPGFEGTPLKGAQAGNGAHVRNFLECVRSRKKPNADAGTGFLSTLPCLLAARSLVTGKAYTWDGSRVREV